MELVLSFSVTGADFTIDTFNITFSSQSGPRQCFSVNIVDDDILENTEVFHLSILPPSDPAVVLQNTVLSVAIENDDSKPVTHALNTHDW